MASLSPESEHYFRLFDKTASEWENRGAEIAKVAFLGRLFGRGGVNAAVRGTGAGSLAELKKLIISGKVNPANLSAEIRAALSQESGLVAAAGRNPGKALLGAAGLGGIIGYGSGKTTGESNARAQAAGGFGAGIATGLAAPSILNGLNQIVANQGLLPGGAAPSDAGYYTQI
jgi:hypothetical protein